MKINWRFELQIYLLFTLGFTFCIFLGLLLFSTNLSLKDF
jgi:hypothetical protein